MTQKMSPRQRWSAGAQLRRIGATGAGVSLMAAPSCGPILANPTQPTFVPAASLGSAGLASAGPRQFGGNVSSATGWLSHTPALASGRHGVSTTSAPTWHLRPLGQGSNQSMAGHVALSSQWPKVPQNNLSPSQSLLPSLGGTQLNLDSSAKNIVLGSNVFQGAASATITVGGKSITLGPGDRVTAGEYLAVNEVIGAGSQSIKLNSSGVGIGGSFSLSNNGLSNLSELVIPKNVTALDNLSLTSTLNVSGELLNYGSLYGYSLSSNQVSVGSIMAKDIINESGGLISTQLPASLVSAVGASLSNTSLTLNAVGAITNSGRITASGNLNLAQGSGILNNAGLVSSSSGNINIYGYGSSTSPNIVVSAVGGTFQAQNGAINIRQPGYKGAANVTLDGGNYLSHTLNINSGTGVVSGNVGNISGQVNSQAGTEHLLASSVDLTLGNNVVTGDPTFINNGNITISGVNTFSQDVTIIANGNITGTNGGAIIDNGYNVTLIAGVAPGSGTPTTGSVTSSSTGISGTTTIDFSSASNRGGNIDFTNGASGTVIDTSSSTYTAGGGTVTLAAFANGSTGGAVLFNPRSAINTNASIYGGQGTNNGGNVNIFAGAAPSIGTVVLQVGNITTNGSNGQQLAGLAGQLPTLPGTGGTVNIVTSQPAATGGSTVTFNSSGDITSGGPLIASSMINGNAQVSVGSILTGAPGPAGPATGGNINIQAGGNVTTGSLATYGTSGFYAIGGETILPANPGGNAGNIAISSNTGSVAVNGSINAAGGSGGNGNVVGSPIGMALAGAPGGAGGKVSISAASGVNLAGAVSTVGGLGGSGADSSHASAGAAGGQGGNVQLSSAAGGINISQGITTSGGSGGNGGSGSYSQYPVSQPFAGAAGAAGGNSGSITIAANSGSVSVGGLLKTSGGSGGVGGNGTAGTIEGPSPSSWIPGGQGGAGGNGGAAGVIQLTSGTLSTPSGIEATGGAGANGGAGGVGIFGSPAAAGGNGGNSGDGGAGANISITSANMSGAVSAAGGAAGQAGFAGQGIPSGTAGAVGTTGQTGNVTIVSSGSTAGTIFGNNVSITAPTGSGDSIVVANNITAQNTLTLGADVNDAGAVKVISGTLTLQSLVVDSWNYPLSLSLQPYAGGPINLTIVNNGNTTISVPTSVNFVGTSNFNFSTVSVITSGGITMQPGAIIYAGTVNLINTSNSGAFTQLDPLTTSTIHTGSLSLSLPGNGNVSLSTTAGSIFGQTNGGNVTLQVNGPTALTGTFKVGNFSLLTTAGFGGAGSITINSGATITATGLVSLSSSESGTGTGGISQQDASTVTTVVAQTLQLADVSYVAGVAQGVGSGNGSFALTTATTGLSASTGAGSVVIQNTGAVALNGANSASSFALTTKPDASGNGAITIAANAVVQAGTISLLSSETAAGTGGITQVDPATTSTLLGTTITLADNLNGGAAGSGSGPITVSVGNQAGAITLSANTKGNTTILSNASVNLNASSGNNFSLATAENGAITVAGNLTALGTVSLLGSGGGGFTANNNVTIIGGNITIIGSSFNLLGTAAINAGANGSVVLMPTGAQTIAIGDTTGTTGQFDITQAMLAQITAGSLTVGNYTSSGNLQVVSNISSFSQGVWLASSGVVTIDSGAAVVSSSISLIGSNAVLGVGASLNAGSGTVTLAPSGLQTIGLADPGSGSFGQFNITAAALGQISAGTLVVGTSNRGGDLEILSSISSFPTSLTISTMGNITDPSGGTLTAGAVSLTSAQGNIGTSLVMPVYTNTSSLSLSAAGSAFVSNSGAVTLGRSTGGTSGTLSISTTPGMSGNGSITIASGATLSAGTVNLASSESNSGGTGGIIQNGSLTSTGIQAANISVADHLYIGSVDQGAGSGAGNISVTIGNGSSSTTLAAATTGNITIDANTSTLTVAASTAITGATVIINGQASSPLNLINAGSITSTNGNVSIASGLGQTLNISGNGTMTAPGGQSINLTATDQPGTSDPNLVFTGSQTFVFSGSSPSGTINLNASSADQSVVINSGATVNFPTNNTTVVLNTTSFVLNGTLNLNNPPNSGSTLVLNAGNSAGVIANDSGAALDLSQIALLTFSGENLAIISAGDITDNGQSLSINLSNSAGSGGQLSILAGVTFTPSTGGVTVGPTNANYTITGTGSGAIELGNTAINTTGSSTGGRVLAVANGPVTLGSINTGGGSDNGGDVTIIGNGVTLTGAINTVSSGPTGSGRVNISSATTNILGTAVIVDGVVSGGTFVAATYGGNVSLSGISSGAQSATIITGSAGSINSSAAISAGSVNLTAGSGGVGSTATALPINASLLTANASGGGSIYLTDSAASVTLSGASSANNFVLSMNGISGAITLGGGAVLTGTGSVTLSASGSGTIDFADNTASINTAALTMLTQGGAIGATNAIITNASSITASAAGAGSAFGNVTIVDTNSGNILLTNNAALAIDNSGNNYNLTATSGSIIIGTGETLTGHASVTLISQGVGTISMVDSSGMILTPSLVMMTNGTAIGANVPVATSASTLTVSAYNGSQANPIYGNVAVNDSATSVSLAPNATLAIDNYANNFALFMTGDASGNGSILLAAGETVTGVHSVTLAAVGNGSIDMVSANGMVNTPNLTLITAGGNIGDSRPIQTNASTITAYAPVSGSVAIKDSSSLVTLSANTGLGIDNTAGSFALTMTGANGSILIGSNETISGNSSVTLVAAGSGTIDMADTTGQINAPSVNLVTAGGAIGANNAIRMGSGNLMAYAFNGSATYGNVNVTGSAGATITLVANNALTLANTGNTFSVTTGGGGGIAIGTGGSVTASTAIDLTAGANGTISQSDPAAALNGPVVMLIAHGGIGTSAAPVLLNSPSVGADAGTASDSFVSDSASSSVKLSGTNSANNYWFTLTNSASTGLFLNSGQVTGTSSVNLTSGSLIDVGGTISAKTIYLDASTIDNSGTLQTQTGGALVLNSAASLTLGLGGTIIAPTALTATAVGNVNLNGFSLTSPGTNVVIVAGGNITDSATAASGINVSSTTGAAGSVSLVAGADFAYAANPTTLNITGNSTSGGSIQLGQNQGFSSIITSGSANGASGSVNLVAFASSAGANGLLNMQDVAITTGKDGSSSTAGAVNVIAGGGLASPATIILGNVSAVAPSAAPVTVTSAQPIAAGVSFVGGALQSAFSYGAINNTIFNYTALSTDQGALTIQMNGSILGGGNLTGHTINLQLSGSTFQTYGAITVPVDAQGNGGAFTMNGSFVGPLDVNVSGTGTGTGGTINFTGSYYTAYVPSFQADSGSQGGNGGKITLNISSLTIPASQLQANPLGTDGNGGIINITSQNFLAITGNLSANGAGTGSGGSIAISTAYSNPFIVGSTSGGNGVSGTLTALGPGGSVQLSNTQGGLSSVLPVTASQVSLSTNTGSIGSSTNPFLVVTPSLTISSSGNAYVSNTGAVTLNASSATNLTLSATGNISTNGSTSIGQVLTINAPSLSINGTDAVSGGSVNINAIAGSDVTLNISALGSLTATSGNLNITGATGNNVIINNTGQIVSQSGNVTVTSTEAATSGYVGGNIVVGGAGTFAASSGTITLTAATQDNTGGASNIEFSGSQTFASNTVLNVSTMGQLVQVDDGAIVVGQSTLTVNGSTIFRIGSGSITGNPLVFNGSGNGGGVIADSTGNLDLSSLGSLVFNGQSLVILSSGNISDSGNTVSINLSNNSGAGGNLSLIAGYSFSPAPGTGINYPPLDTTDAYVLSTGGTGSINLGHTSVITSGSTSAGGVLAVATGSIALGSITARGGTGSGGSVTLLGAGITVGGNIDTTSAAGPGSAGKVTITAAAPIMSGNVIASGGTLAGGFFQPGAASGSLMVAGISSGANSIALTASGTGASITSTGTMTAANIAINTAGAVNLVNGTGISLLAGASGAGGVLTISANNVTWSNFNAAPLVVNASANGTAGNGGDISISLQTTAAQSIGTQAGAFDLTANGGTSSGKGGQIDFTTGGNLGVAAIGISAGVLATSGNGGIIDLTAGQGGTGQLLISGSLSVSGKGSGLGGDLSLTADSTTVFNIGSTSKTNTNGVMGSLSAAGSGGTISVVNLSGGLTNSVSLASVADLYEQAGGSGALTLGSSLVTNKGLALVSLTSVSGAITSSSTIISAKVLINSASGNIGTGSSAFRVSAGEVQGSGGIVNISDADKNAVTIDTSSAVTTFKFVGAGALSTSASITAGTSATVTAGGSNAGISLGGNIVVSSTMGTESITATGTGSISAAAAGDSLQASTLTIKSASGTIGGAGQALSVQASVLNLTTTAAVNLANSGSAPLTVNGSGTKGAFALTSDANITIAKAISTATSVAIVTNSGSNGAIAIDAAVGGTATTTITVAANGSGDITSSTSGKLETKSTGTVGLSSGSGNIGLGSASTAALSVYSGNMAINTGGTGLVNVASKLTTTIAVADSTSGAGFTLTTAGTTTLDGINASGGGITVIDSTGTLNTAVAAGISAGNGSIILENANKTSGNIFIGDRTTIGTMSTVANGGQVNLVIGPVPASPVAGTAPSAVTVNTVTSGSAFFGKGIIANTAQNIINLKGSDVVFNVGTRPTTAITLDGGVTITADPVVSATVTTVAIVNAVIPEAVSAVQPVSASLVPAATGIRVLVSALQAPATPPLSPLSIQNGFAPLVSLATLSAPVDVDINAIGSNRLAQSEITGVLSSLTSGFTASNYADNQSAQVSYAGVEPEWASETELTSGAIPAMIYGKRYFGVKNDVSTIVDVEDVESMESKNAPETLPARVTSAHEFLQPDNQNKTCPTIAGQVSENREDCQLVNLRFGSVIFAPTSAMVVKTPLGAIRLAANSISLIMVQAKRVAVFNLLDTQADSVVLVSARLQVSLTPGTMTVVSAEKAAAFESINPAQRIGYRNLQELPVGGALTAYRGQFSIPHAIATIMPLRAMIHSSNNQSKNISAKILKTAAILEHLTGGDYQPVIRPDTTAYLH